MTDESKGSVTRWIESAKLGGDSAAKHLLDRYFDRLVRLAQNKFRTIGQRGGAADAEDVAASAFDSFCLGLARGRFPNVLDRDDLWRLLVALTLHKAIDQVRKEKALKSGGGKVIPASSLPAADDGSHPRILDFIASGEPGPEWEAMFAEQHSKLRHELGDDSLRQVLDMRLEGCEREEIAARLGCAVRTVTRKLDVIRQTWLREDRA